MSASLGVRWTVGDVSSRGWEALRLSVHCAVRLFGPATGYIVCANSIDLAHAKHLAGELPSSVQWQSITAADTPAFLKPHLDRDMAEGVGWKLLPLRLFPGRHELALDNDCILWTEPPALTAWRSSTDHTLLAGDMERCLGIFQNSAVPDSINSGIRGLPPYFDLAEALRRTLADKEAETGQPVHLTSELDEQGMQAVALHRDAPSLVVPTADVTICSPFWPRNPELGRCGAHFVGLNSKHIPWNYFDRPGSLVRREHWDRHRPELYRRANLPFTPPLPLDQP